MIKEIILKETYYLITSRKYFIALSSVIILTVINSFLITSLLEQDIENYTKVKNQNIERLDDHRKEFSQIVFFLQNIIKKSSHLTYISSANDIELPNGIDLNFFGITNFKDYKKDEFISNTFITFDLTNILIYIFSFIIIIFSYDSISGEKKDGTLKLLASYTIKKWEILIGKYLGIFISIISLFIIGLLINILIMLLSPSVNIVVEDVYKIVFFFLSSLIFISFFIITGILISSLTSSPAQSLSLLLVVWTLLTLIIPNIGWLISKKTNPVKSYADVKRQENIMIKEIQDSDKYTFNWDADWEGHPPNNKVIKRAEGFKEITRTHNDLWRNYKQTILTQTKNAIKFSEISPIMLFRFIGEKISDNGFYGYLNFNSQIEIYFNTYHQYLISFDQNDKNSYHLIWNEDWASVNFMSKEPLSFAEIPKFEYKNPNIIKILTNCFWEFFILLTLTIIIFAITYFVFIKYDVR